MKSEKGNRINKLLSAIGKLGSSAEIRSVSPFCLILDEAGNLTIAGCPEIVDYTPEEIRFSCKKFEMTVLGSNLGIYDYSSENTSINGDIGAIMFSHGGID